MRTIAETQHSAAAGARATATSRRARPGPTASGSRPASPPEAPVVAVTYVRMLRVDAGLYALRIGPIAGNLGEIAGMVVPVVQISAPFAEDGNGVEIIASYPRKGPWLDKEGGTVILRSPAGGGLVVVTVYGGAEQQTSEPDLALQHLDGPGNGVAEPGQTGARSVAAGSISAPAATEARDIPTEILLHIERAGDRLFPGRGWVGALGREQAIAGALD